MPVLNFDQHTGTVTLVNHALELTIATRPWYNPRHLCDLDGGRTFADSDYIWSDGQPAVLIGLPQLTTASDGTATATFQLKKGSLEIEHAFTMPGAEPNVLLEVITLRNPGAHAADSASFACGFAKRVQDGQAWLADVADANLCEIPYRHHPETGELRDFKVPALLETLSWYSPVRSPIYRRQTSPAYGSEAWAWYGVGTVLLFSKYNPDAMEWSVLEPIKRTEAGVEQTILRFGGAARWKLGDPEGAARLAPGASFTFGETRYSLLPGGWPAAFADFRRYTERKGHRLPANFSQPVHWNELYDNPYWWAVMRDGWHVDRPETRAALYNLPLMQIEIDKAVEIGCECLYLDPGWDTDFGSTIWDETRLGQQADFVKMLRDQYSLALALHTPLAPWSNHASYPLTARQMGPNGQRRDDLCVISAEYLAIKAERLRELCRNGAYFLMFDGSWYDQPCYDPGHGHAVPSTRQEHVDAILALAQNVHAAHPQAVIEQHDPIIGPGTPRYAPTYFMHGKPGAVDELWGFEYMLNALADLASRRAFALYYFNLAYSIPVYLHFDLRTDNHNAVGFWWFASTCRHLGIGGQHSDPRVWAAHKQAMAQYLEHKRLFAQGTFFGLDELTHGHTLAQARACVINCFNLEDEPVTRTLEFRLADVGLPNGTLEVTGGNRGITVGTIGLAAAGNDTVIPLPGQFHVSQNATLAGILASKVVRWQAWG